MRLDQELTKGIIKENPVFILLLGLCPVLATSSAVKDGLAMGIAASVVLICSNVIISIIRKIVPKQVRIPCYIVVIASFVTIVKMLMKAYLSPEISSKLGLFIPLIVVNCIILGRAEAFASRHGVFRSFLDGVGIGAGFTVALVLIATIREVLGNGTFAGIPMPFEFQPASVMIMAPGAFLVLGLLLGFFNWLKGKQGASETGCGKAH